MTSKDDLSAHQQHILSICTTGPLSTLESLLSSTPISSLPSTESMALAAISSRQPAILQRILESSSSPTSLQRTLTIAAIKTGDFPILETLLSTKFITINEQLGYMGTPLLYATHLGHPAAYISALFERGADPNVANMGGGTWSGLAVAATSGDEEVVRIFLANGAAVAKSRALWEAAGRGRLGIVKILVLEASADVNEVPNGDDIDVLSPVVLERGVGTALHEAAREGHGEIVRFLLEHGAEKEIRDTNGLTAEDVAKVYKRQDVGKILQEFST